MVGNSARVALPVLTSEAVSEIFVDLEMRNAAETRGTFTIATSPTLRVICSSTAGTGCQIVRQSTATRQNPSRESYCVCSPRSGAIAVTQAGRRSVLTAGDFVLLDTRLDYTIDLAPKLEAIWLGLSIECLEEVIDHPHDIVGRRLSGTRGVGYIASQFISSLSVQCDDSDRGGLGRLGWMLAEFVHGASAGRDTVLIPDRATRHTTMDRARAYIDLHLGNDRLSPNDIAAGIGVSRRYLSELFAGEGTTIMGWVTMRRLNLCAAELERSSPRSGLVTEVAFKYGFINIASFNRAYRRAFDATPRQMIGARRMVS